MGAHANLYLLLYTDSFVQIQNVCVNAFAVCATYLYYAKSGNILFENNVDADQLASP